VAAGCGCLLRNSSGQWIGGFSCHLGMCGTYLAELWGVLDGLLGLYGSVVSQIKLKVQMDSKVVVFKLILVALSDGDLFRRFVSSIGLRD
jgi:hypothetical protein